MKHICAYCANNGFENNHTSRACNRKRGNSGTSYKSNIDDKQFKQKGGYVSKFDNNNDQSKN